MNAIKSFKSKERRRKDDLQDSFRNISPLGKTFSKDVDADATDNSLQQQSFQKVERWMEQSSSLLDDENSVVNESKEDNEEMMPINIDPFLYDYSPRERYERDESIIFV